MTDLQGWEFALFLFRSSLFRSKSLFLKSNCERFALYRRVMRANWSRCSLKKSDVSDSLVICVFALKKRAICSIKFVFLTVFTVFPLFMPKNESRLSLFAPSLFSKRESLFCSFAHKKRATRSKKQKANSQPCRFGHICYLQVGWIFQLP